jgi:hypothetical protein
MKVSCVETQSGLGKDVGTRRLEVGCWIALIAIAVVRAWFTRYELEPDSMSYLDMARAIATGHAGAAINGSWSPGYPVLVALFLWIFRPGMYWEFPLVHLINVLIFVGTITCFRLFWAEALRWHKEFAKIAIPDGAFWALGYAGFGIATLNVIRIGRVGPDLLVAAICCLAGWSGLRLRRVPSFSGAMLLGCVLALGYYVKAPFFPMAIIFILCACLSRTVSWRALLLAGSAIVTFLLVSAPLIAALSSAKGRLTFGDSARLNQAFYINGVQYFCYWQGGPPGSGMPVHPTRKLNKFPAIYEYAAQNMGTFPPWFDPTYWYEGITPHLDVKRQTAVFIRNLAVEFQIVIETAGALVCVLIFLTLLCGERWGEGLKRLWLIWTPGAIALVMFALIHVESRYLGGWLILCFAGVVCACSLPTNAATRAVWCISAAALITTGTSLILQASREAVGSDHELGRSSQDVSLAASLLNSGLHPGDQVALLGDGIVAYWAHLARLHPVAEIPAPLDFWESRPEQQQDALRILERTGAKAVVAGWQHSDFGLAPSSVPPPWKRINGTGVYVYFFPTNVERALEGK